ncbi:ATP-binding protein [Bilifractor sp. HCP3S3_D3]|uniref:ATP-binding protein n=1 Tax=unclassified Bilifractor TaxID=2815795 RepID=UPI003F8B8753
MQNIKPQDHIDIAAAVPYILDEEYQGYNTAPLTREEKEIGEKFQMPEVGVRLIDFFFTEEDRKFILSFDGTPVSYRSLDPGYAADAFRRGVLARVRRDDTPEDPDAAADPDYDYTLNNFYGMLDVLSVNETRRYHTLPADLRVKLDQWYFDEYEKSLDPDPRVRPTTDEIISLQEMLDFIDQEERPLYLARCDCKCLGGQAEDPTNTCINFVHGDNSFVTRKISDRITKEQAKQIIRDADKAGLVHTISDHGICNCNATDCYLFRVQRDRRSVGFWPKAPHIISYDANPCIGCGRCVKRCRFDVISMTGRGKNASLSFRMDECNGCGICASTCPADALHLVPRKTPAHTPQCPAET